MDNKDLKIAMIQNNVRQYEVAKQLGISEYYFSKKMRYELTKEEKAKVMKAIEELQKNK